jgi:hypothetical protein
MSEVQETWIIKFQPEKEDLQIIKKYVQILKDLGSKNK